MSCDRNIALGGSYRRTPALEVVRCDTQLCVYFLVRAVCALSDAGRERHEARERAAYSDSISLTDYARACERGYARGY